MAIEKILNEYIHEHIPLSQALGAVVKYASNEKIVVTAPFLNNINHKSTVFGGSLHAIATLACWGLLYTNLMNKLGNIDIVICKSEIDYLKPVTQDFEAVSLKPELEDWLKFEKRLERKGKSRLEIKSHIYEKGALAVSYLGLFAVLKR